MNRNSKNKTAPGRAWPGFFIGYTLLYAVLFGFILCFFAAEHRSLVYHADAWRQHLRALAYYGKWLRGCAWNLLHGEWPVLQTWSFGLGYGADVVTTLQYYCLGEPLAFLTILVPERFCKLWFEVLIVLRPYLAGLSFAAYVRYSVPYVRRRAILGGALVYAFCGTVLYLGMLHPFFVTPMIYFPLLLLGVERVLQEKRPLVLMLSVWMAGITNFYFFYMLAILTAVYGVCRVLFRARRAWKHAFAELLALLGGAVVGTMAAGAILVPILVQYQSDPRSATEFSLSLFYEPAYYQELFQNLVTFINHPLYDTELCTTIFGAAALVLLLIRRGHRQLKTAALGCAVMLCFPAAGYLLNGTSYVINRWTFAAEFLLALVLTVVWDECAAGLDRKSDSIAARHLERLALAGLIACIAGNIYLGYARIPADADGEGGQSGYASEFTDAQTPAEYMNAAYWNEAAVIDTISSRAENAAAADASADAGSSAAGSIGSEASAVQMSAVGLAGESLQRYTGRDLTYNAGAQLGHSSTQFFWSFANGAVSDFFQALGVNEEQNFCYTGLDDRAALEALAGVQYYSIAYDNSYEQQFVPYGFTDLGTAAGDSGVPETIREKLQAENAGEYASSESGTDAQNAVSAAAAGLQTAESAADESTAADAAGTNAAADGIPEQSGAVLGDDSWEAVRPEYHLYGSMFALPLGYTYTGVLSAEDFVAMTPTQRQEAMVQGVLLGEAQEAEGAASAAQQPAAADRAENSGENTGGTTGLTVQTDTGNAAMQNVLQPEFYEQELPYTVETEEGIAFAQGEGGDACFVVTDPSAAVTLTFTGTEDAETYLLLQDLEVTTLGDMEEHLESSNEAGIEESSSGDEQAAVLLAADAADGNAADIDDTLQEVYPITVTASRSGESLIDKTINYKTSINQYYSGWKDFALNLGYNSSAPDTITIRFAHTGCYTVSRLAVIGQPMAELMTKSVERAVCTLQNTDLHRNPISGANREITGTLNAEQDRILVLSIPYSTGWTAYDNGEKAELQKANLMYLAMPVSAGSHEIRLVYHTPGGRLGALISAAGILLIIGTAARGKKENKACFSYRERQATQ